MKKIILIILFSTFFYLGCGKKTAEILTLDNFVLSETRNGPASLNNNFEGVDTIYLSFDILNFKQNRSGIVWLQEDLKLVGPGGKIVEWVNAFGEVKKFDYQNIEDINKKFPKKTKVIPLTNVITLPPNSEEGDYKLEVTVRDKIAQTEAKKEIIFRYLKPKEEVNKK